LNREIQTGAVNIWTEKKWPITSISSMPDRYQLAVSTTKVFQVERAKLNINWV